MPAPLPPIQDVSLEDIPKILHLLSQSEQERLFAELSKLEKLKEKQLAQQRFLPFVRKVWPSFIAGAHHAKMAAAFERVANGTCKRLIINMPPRHTKSEFASYLLPAWFLGRYPHKKVIQTAHTAELAVNFGRKVRNLVDTDIYREIFPDLVLSADSKAAGRWNTSQQGDYFAIGVGGAVTGKGADCAYYSCRVLTTRGILRIVDVRVGDYVYGYDHKTNTPRWSRVLAGSTQRKPNLVNVRGFLCTPEHQVFTSSGYCAASEAGDVAVLGMRGRVPAGSEGVRALTGALQNPSPLLFESVQRDGQEFAGMRVWEPEGTACGGVQTLLPEGEDCTFDLHPVRGALRAESIGAQKERGSTRGDAQCVLLEGLLRGASGDAPSGVFADYGYLPDLQGTHTEGEEILFDAVLRGAESPEHGVFREVVVGQTRGEETRFGGLRVVWTNETAGGRASYKSRSNGQSDGELRDSMRTVPRPISYTDGGTCADDFATVLPGEGFWVVDIQTETENFFVWGPDAAPDSSPVLAHNCLIIDDPHSEQEAALAETNPEVYDKTYEWFTSGPRQRLQPGGAIVIVQTRWSKRDLTGRVLQASALRGGDEWEVIEFPAILPSGKPLWPEFWPLEELQALKEELPNSKWMAQYQQNPTSEQSAIIKREWWKLWDKPEPPPCDFVLMAWDTAFEASQRADYSAVTTWGVFYMEDETGIPQANLILLNAFRDRMEFPALKRAAIEHYTEWQPDSVIIEKKASGAPLIYEMRAMGIPVQEFTPTRGNDKITRLNAVSDIFASGRVWVPDTHWAEEVVEEVASFPSGMHDDYVDSTSLALMRFRKGGYIGTALDEPDEPTYFKSNRNKGYY